MTLALATLYLAGLIWRGFVTRRVGLGTWHMFAAAPYCDLALREPGAVAAFDPWRYLPRHRTAMNRGELELFLCYLARVHHLHLDGTVRARRGARVEILRVVDTHVVG